MDDPTYPTPVRELKEGDVVETRYPCNKEWDGVVLLVIGKYIEEDGGLLIATITRGPGYWSNYPRLPYECELAKYLYRLCGGIEIPKEEQR